MLGTKEGKAERCWSFYSHSKPSGGQHPTDCDLSGGSFTIPQAPNQGAHVPCTELPGASETIHSRLSSGTTAFSVPASRCTGLPNTSWSLSTTFCRVLWRQTLRMLRNSVGEKVLELNVTLPSHSESEHACQRPEQRRRRNSNMRRACQVPAPAQAHQGYA